MHSRERITVIAEQPLKVVALSSGEPPSASPEDGCSVTVVCESVMRPCCSSCPIAFKTSDSGQSRVLAGLTCTSEITKIMKAVDSRVLVSKNRTRWESHSRTTTGAPGLNLHAEGYKFKEPLSTAYRLSTRFSCDATHPRERQLKSAVVWC